MRFWGFGVQNMGRDWDSYADAYAYAYPQRALIEFVEFGLVEFGLAPNSMRWGCAILAIWR